jgi:predicted phage terminase large subunit-like protein
MDALALFQERLLAKFDDADLERLGWWDRPLNTRDARLELAEVDLEFFARYYLAHHFTLPLCAPHRALFADLEWCIETPGPVRMVEAMPRGFGKTTIITLAFVLWCLCFGYRRFILIISDSQKQAKEQLSTLKAEIEGNEALLDDFGSMIGKHWTEVDIELITPQGTEAKVMALGSGTKVLGLKFREQRPDMQIVDDPENHQDVQSASGRERIRRWFNSSIMRGGAPDAKTIGIGTVLHYDCLIRWMLDNPSYKPRRRYQTVLQFAEDQALWDQWRAIFTDRSQPDNRERARAFFEAHEPEMLKGTEVAWPERYPYYDCMVMKVSEGDASFNSELQNEPVDPEDRYFKEYSTYRKIVGYVPGSDDTWLVPWDKESDRPSGKTAAVPLKTCKLYAVTDPAMGKSKDADYSAIIILAVAPTNYCFVLEADLKRAVPDVRIADQARWMQVYPQILRWGMETVQMQEFYRNVSARDALEQYGARLPVMPIQLKNMNKDVRIHGLQPDIVNGYILIDVDSQQLLKEELEQYPFCSHRDGLDALEQCYSMVDISRMEPSPGLTHASTYQFGDPELDSSRNVDPYAEMDRQADVNIWLLKMQEEEERAKKEGRPVNEIKAPEPFFPITFL